MGAVSKYFYQAILNDKVLFEGNVNDTAKFLKSSPSGLCRAYIDNFRVNGYKINRVPVPFDYGRDYALYKGDNFLMIGTKNEIAKRIGVRQKTIEYYMSPSYREKAKKDSYVVVKIEGDD